MTRTAISPRLAIKIFWSTGANVGAVSSRGDIWKAVNWPAGWDVRHVTATGSTNTDLLVALEHGTAGHRTVLVADHQTAGRGRLDRRWDAPAGSNLLVSVAIAPVPDPPADATHRVALATLGAVRALRPDDDVALKWPNDLLSGGRKLAGVLAQRSAIVDGLVVGLGLNVGWSPRGAARLGHDLEPADVLGRVLVEFDRLPDELGPSYREALATLGQRVRIEMPARGTVIGRAIDLDEDGRLVVALDDGSTAAYDVGDVVHLRTVPQDAAGESSV